MYKFKGNIINKKREIYMTGCGPLCLKTTINGPGQLFLIICDT